MVAVRHGGAWVKNDNIRVCDLAIINSITFCPVWRLRCINLLAWPRVRISTSRACSRDAAAAAPLSGKPTQRLSATRPVGAAVDPGRPWLFDWVFNVLANLGLYKSAKILFLGLDNAGETTLPRVLKENPADPPADAAPEPGRADHRQHPVQDLRPRRPRDGAAALEGHFTTVDGVVYMVDALDKERFSRRSGSLCTLTCDELASVPCPAAQPPATPSR